MDLLIVLTEHQQTIWKYPIERKKTESMDEEIFVNEMTRVLLSNYRGYILEYTSQIIMNHINKSNRSLREKVLIKNQIYNNIIDNIINIVFNQSKDYYYTQPTTEEIVDVVDEQV